MNKSLIKTLNLNSHHSHHDWSQQYHWSSQFSKWIFFFILCSFPTEYFSINEIFFNEFFQITISRYFGFPLTLKEQI